MQASTLASFPTIEEETFEILVAEDDPVARELIESIFEVAALPRPVIAADGLHALEELEAQRYDILITDLNMPSMSGEELVKRALEIDPDLTIVVITGNGTIDRAVSVMKDGAHDFISKPYSVETFLTSLRKAKHRVLSIHEVKGMREVVNALLAALESKDRYLEGHAERVSRYARELGKLMGLPRNEIRMLEFSGLLHDVGKIGIHEDILNKPGKLTAEEYEIMKQHPVMSRDILVPVTFMAPCLPWVLHHHERIDGKGYPFGLSGEEIPLGARIIAIVDAFDAMTSQRSYRDALTLEQTLEILQEVAGTQLDSEIVDMFVQNLEAVTGLKAGVEA